MKTSKSIVHLGLLAVLAIGLLGSCSEETETLSPQPVEPVEPTEEEVKILSNAIPIDPPESDEVTEDLSDLPFPEQSPSNARTQELGDPYFVDFDDPDALDRIHDDAINTSVIWPFYIQKVGFAWINVWEYVKKVKFGKDIPEYGHYHLSYQDFIPEINTNGNFCKPYYGDCIGFDPTQERRYLTTHASDQCIEIFAYDYASYYKVFDLKGIKVINGPLKIRFRKQNGHWYQFSSVEPGTYNFSSITSGITKALITGVSGSPVSFDDIKVNVPLN